MSDQAEILRSRIQQQKKQAKTIAFASGKGGVGKSNTALNFALELQQNNQSVLLLDLDVGMGNIDILLGNNSTYSFAHFFTDLLPIHGIKESGPKGLSYVAGGANLAELIDVDEQYLEHFFSEYNELVFEYDYILFDLGAGVTATTMAFILSADECFIVTTPEPTAITDAYSVVKQIVLKNAHLPIHLLMNRCPSIKEGNEYIQRFVQVVNRFLEKDMRSASILLEDKAVTKAVMQQNPYVLSQPKAAISFMMAKIVAAYVADNPLQAVNKQSSFVNKLKRLLMGSSK